MKFNYKLKLSRDFDLLENFCYDKKIIIGNKIFEYDDMVHINQKVENNSTNSIYKKAKYYIIGVNLCDVRDVTNFIEFIKLLSQFAGNIYVKHEIFGNPNKLNNFVCAYGQIIEHTIRELDKKELMNIDHKRNFEQKWNAILNCKRSFHKN